MKAPLLYPLLILLFLPNSVLCQRGEFIQLRDSTILEGKVEMNERLFRSKQIILNDTLHFSLIKVESYSDGYEYYRRVSTTPFSSNDFAKRVERGNIDLYEFFEFKTTGPNYMPGPNGTSMFMGYNSAPVSMQFFSKDGGPLKKVTARNLKIALADNPESMAYLKKRDNLTAVQIVGSIVGAAIIGGSIAKMANDNSEDINFNPTGLFLGGVIINGSIWIPHFSKQGLTQDAIREYNRPGGSSWMDRYGN